jgi:DNA mismatch repair protein MutH
MDTQSLLSRAQSLSGKSFLQVAQLANLKLSPNNRLNTKGWLGQTLESFLGATAGSQSLPDFVDLGIELKTIPLLENGTPKESTYICTAPMPIRCPSWEQSRVLNKLRKVLWFPYFYNKQQPFENQRLGTPLFWSPNEGQYLKLKSDWEELVERINLGNIESLSAHMGECLQIRPKASRSSVQTLFINHEGEQISTTPKGFYLRPSFTKEIILTNYLF